MTNTNPTIAPRLVQRAERAIAKANPPAQRGLRRLERNEVVPSRGHLGAYPETPRHARRPLEAH